MKNLLKSLIILILITCGTLFSQNDQKNKLAILPFHSNGIDDVSLESAETIFRQELAKIDSFKVISMRKTLRVVGEDLCAEPDCAVELGKKLDVDNVLYFNFLTLGRKIIVQYTLVDISNSKVLLDERLTTTSIEDFDTVMKRIAYSVSTGETAFESAQIGMITKGETQKPLLRNSRKFYGFSFGYYKPIAGFDDEERSFTLEFVTGAELETFAYGLKLFAKNGFGTNVFISYLASKKDFCPYIGTGIGFHWINDDLHYEKRYSDFDYGSYHYEDYSDGKADGLELSIHGGIRLFHTYNFRINLSFEYAYTFNDFDDQAISFTIGFLR